MVYLPGSVLYSLVLLESSTTWWVGLGVPSLSENWHFFLVWQSLAIWPSLPHAWHFPNLKRRWSGLCLAPQSATQLVLSFVLAEHSEVHLCTPLSSVADAMVAPAVSQQCLLFWLFEPLIQPSTESSLILLINVPEWQHCWYHKQVYHAAFLLKFHHKHKVQPTFILLPHNQWLTHLGCESWN